MVTSYHTYTIDSLQVVSFLLGNCQNTQEVRSLLQQSDIIGIEDPITHSVAPLHWIVYDQSGNCLVIEKRKEGLFFLDNPIGILSNSPNFEWHMLNLRNYLGLSPVQYEEANWNSVILTSFGQGGGTFGLPGDYTPPSRFIKAAFMKSFVALPQNQSECVNTFFHLAETVSIPKGIVVTRTRTS